MFGRALLTGALLVLGLAPAALAAPPEASTSIVGGQDADIDDWPSIAFLLSAWDADGDGDLDEQAQCTGTVIAPQWVVSAAHCAFTPNDELVDAMLTMTGDADTDDLSGEVIAADRLVVHGDWDPEFLTGDVLLIHLRSRSSAPAHPFAQPGVNYVTLEHVPNAAGWGAVDEEATIGTALLKEAWLELQSDQDCEPLLTDPPAQTCAGTLDTAGVCRGDSGGPLLVFDDDTGAPVLWGLTSYGPQIGFDLPVCSLEMPAVFSWVPAFSTFVSSTITPPVRPSQPAPPAPNPSPPAGTTIVPARPDTVKPVLRRARLSTRRLRVGRKATLSFRLSEAAVVTVTVMKKRGRRYRALKPTLPLAADAGTYRRRFDGRLGSRRLKPGGYKLRLIAVDAAGNAARPVTVAFRVVR